MVQADRAQYEEMKHIVRTNLACPHCHARLSRTARFCPRCGKTVGEVIAGQREHRRMRSLPVDNATLEMVRNYIDHGGPVQRDDRSLLFGINRHRAWQIVKECALRAGLG